MAFNWKTFWTRAYTALIFVAVMAAGFLWNAWTFFGLISLIHFGCWYEYIRLTNKTFATRLHPWAGIGIALLGFHILLLFNSMNWQGYQISGSFTLPFLVAGLVLFLMGIFKQGNLLLPALIQYGAGLLYISLSLGLLLDLRLSDLDIIREGDTLWGRSGGFYIPVILILAIWVNDTMAYLVGSAIGKTPFSKISPKKTLEGTLGGMLLCVVAIVFGLQSLFHWQLLLGISLLAAGLGTLGDLLESWLKRRAGVKDSGRILPGHGGFLDRFDSLLIAIPAVWLLLNIYFQFTA
ncbi:hypothetical protein GCM10027051_21550 [Niabella terrae]